MWRELLVYSVKNKAYIGCDLPDLGNDNENDIENDADKSEPKAGFDVESELGNIAAIQHSDANPVGTEGIDNENDIENDMKREHENKHEADINFDSNPGNVAAQLQPNNNSYGESDANPVGTEGLASPAANSLATSALSDSPVQLVTRDEEILKLRDANSRRPKRVSCAKFIAESASPSPSKMVENSSICSSTDSVHWSCDDEVSDKSNLENDWEDRNDIKAQGSEFPKPKRKSRVRLVSKDRKRQERTIFDRVLRKDDDTDSESNCGRNWFPSVFEWVNTESDTSAPDDSQSSMEMKSRRTDWSTVDEMLNSLKTQSQLYREKHSGDRETLSKQNDKSSKKTKPTTKERNLVLDTLFAKGVNNSDDNLSVNGNGKEGKAISGKNTEDSKPEGELTDKSEGDVQLTNEDLNDNENGFYRSTKETIVEHYTGQMVFSKERLAEVHADEEENKAQKDFREEDDEEYKRWLKMCNTTPPLSDPPSELESKIIRQIEVSFVMHECQSLTPLFSDLND